MKRSSPHIEIDRNNDQEELFKEYESSGVRGPNEELREPKASLKKTVNRRTDLFGKALLKEAISLLPLLPDTDDIKVAREFVRANLHSNARETRIRNSNYIISRMFPNGVSDKALRFFAKKYKGRQELRDAAFYRFCLVEPLVPSVIDRILFPNLGARKVDRSEIRSYLSHRYPGSKSVKHCVQPIVDALTASGLARADRRNLYFSYRDICLPSLAFMLHSEFPEPGMFEIAKLETGRLGRLMLWQPDRIVPSLYELRNRGVISKVSEIDTSRQFTLKWTLSELVDELYSSRIDL